MKTTTANDFDIEYYRKLVQTYINLHTYNAALFWADKVVALTEGNPKDVYWLAQCMFLLKQYHRAAFLLKIHNLDKLYIICNNLAARCLFEANELNEALKILNLMETNNSLETSAELFDDTPKHQIQASISLLKGNIFEAMDNRGLATDCYKQALQYDVNCYEAFDGLIQHHMLTADEEEELLNLLPISQQCSPQESEILVLLYKSKLKKYHIPGNTIITASYGQVNLPPFNIVISPASVSSLNTQVNAKTQKKDKNAKDISEKMHTEHQDNIYLTRLQNSLDLIVTQSERLYYDCDYTKCSMLTESILKQDPYHTSCLPIHISCQVELNESNKLFMLAHKLVNLYPNLPISWFAVGCYYYIIGNRDVARRYLAKATSLDRLFGPAWLAYGHSFAIENEHDQAMAAYFKASQLMKGCHLPLLYIGLECGLTNNVRLAEKFFQQAHKIAPEDPFVMHEMGVIAFQNLDYNSAQKYFKQALDLIKHNNHGKQRWAPLLNNMGHTLRKLRNYKEALQYHHEALVLCPQSASTFSAIAYAHALMGNLGDSIDWFHKALSLKRDDTFSTTMLNYVTEQFCEDESPYPDAPEGIPSYTLINMLNCPTEDVSDVPPLATTNASNMSMDMEMSELSKLNDPM